MPRTVVYPVAFRSPEGSPNIGGDGFPERLVKYVPAETLAFFVPFSAFVGTDRWMALAAILAGLAGTVGYLWLSARRVPLDERPLPHFYVLAGIAFLCWAPATSTGVATIAHMSQLQAGAVLMLAVFLIPLLDELLVRWLGRSS